MVVVDTHVLVWWLAEPANLSVRARRAIKHAADRKAVAVSAISLFEIATLLRRDRLQLTVDSERWLEAVRSLPELVIEPISAEIAWLAGLFGKSVPGDPADRIITATARVLGATFVAADEKLRSSTAVQTVW